MTPDDMTNVAGSILFKGLGFHITIWVTICYGVGQGIEFIRSRMEA